MQSCIYEKYLMSQTSCYRRNIRKQQIHLLTSGKVSTYDKSSFSPSDGFEVVVRSECGVLPWDLFLFFLLRCILGDLVHPSSLSLSEESVSIPPPLVDWLEEPELFVSDDQFWPFSATVYISWWKKKIKRNYLTFHLRIKYNKFWSYFASSLSF